MASRWGDLDGGLAVVPIRLSLRTANGSVETVSALTDLPAMRDAFAEGRLSFDQVRYACRLATPETDADWAGQAGLYSVSRLEVMARRKRMISTTESNEAHRERSLLMGWDHDRRFLSIRGQLPEEQGAMVERALNRLADRHGKNPATGTWDRYEARAADALVELASQSPWFRFGSRSGHDRGPCGRRFAGLRGGLR